MRIVEVVLMTLASLWHAMRQDFNLLELALIGAGIWAWTRGWRPRAPSTALRSLSSWKTAAIIVIGTIALRLALLPVLPKPVPVVADEFSHLLLADTLAHGRLANPAHPFWQHFESIHILQQPHYVSNYFPGRAAVLAAALALFHDPWIGVLAECAAFLAALYWMLRGWMPARWALFGLVLASLRFGIASYWMNSYYGGFVAALGGALIAGSFPRLLRSASAIQACVFGCGLAILASTRPFEGFFYSLPWIGALAWHRRKQARQLAKILAPVFLSGCAAVLALGVYFKHVTGSPLVTAYQISQRTYGWPVEMPWDRPRLGIAHRHAELAQYYEYEISVNEKVSGPVNFLEYLVYRLDAYWLFYFGPALTLPLLMLPRVWRRRPMLLAGAGGALVAILLEGGSMPHYLAPAAAVLVAIVVEGCRHLRAARVSIVHLLPATMALVLVLRIGAQSAGLPYTQKLNYQSWCCMVQGNLNKARIRAALEKIPGDHLVFVKPKTDPYNLLQWIYNDADIDASRIVWARDMGPEENARLAKYFAQRDIWLVDPNVEPATCRKYTDESAHPPDSP